jgi:hypothetical protein
VFNNDNHGDGDNTPHAAPAVRRQVQVQHKHAAAQSRIQTIGWLRISLQQKSVSAFSWSLHSVGISIRTLLPVEERQWLQRVSIYPAGFSVDVDIVAVLLQEGVDALIFPIKIALDGATCHLELI